MRMIVAVFLAVAANFVAAQPPPVPGSPVAGTTGTKEDPWFKKKAKKPDKSIRDLTGTVYDSKNNRIAGAVVRLTDTETGEGQEMTTAKDGSYRFEDTKRETTYKVTAQFNSLQATPRSLTPYDTRNEPNLNLTLEAPKPAPKAAPPKKEAKK
jgi:hypothetical protein